MSRSQQDFVSVTLPTVRNNEDRRGVLATLRLDLDAAEGLGLQHPQAK